MDSNDPNSVPFGASSPGALGARTPLGAAPGAPRKPLGDLGAAQHKKHLKSAQSTIFFVGIITIAFSGFYLFAGINEFSKFESELAALRSNPLQIINESKVTEIRALMKSRRGAVVCLC